MDEELLLIRLVQQRKIAIWKKCRGKKSFVWMKLKQAGWTVLDVNLGILSTPIVLEWTSRAISSTTPESARRRRASAPTGHYPVITVTEGEPASSPRRPTGWWSGDEVYTIDLVEVGINGSGAANTGQSYKIKKDPFEVRTKEDVLKPPGEIEGAVDTWSGSVCASSSCSGARRYATLVLPQPEWELSPNPGHSRIS